LDQPQARMGHISLPALSSTASFLQQHTCTPMRLAWCRFGCLLSAPAYCWLLATSSTVHCLKGFIPIRSCLQLVCARHRYAALHWFGCFYSSYWLSLLL